MKSELSRKPHESKSESGGPEESAPHESKSEFGLRAGGAAHVSKSEPTHETGSEPVRETEPDFVEPPGGPGTGKSGLPGVRCR